MREYTVFSAGKEALVALAAEARALRGGGGFVPSAFKHMRQIKKLTTLEKIFRKRGRRAGED